MDEHLLIAIVAAVLNMILSVLVPCALKKSDVPFLVNIRNTFDTHREMLISSSLLVGVIVFISLKALPTVKVEMNDVLSRLASLSN